MVDMMSLKYDTKTSRPFLTNIQNHKCKSYELFVQKFRYFPIFVFDGYAFACVYNSYNMSQSGSDKSITWSFAIRKKENKKRMILNEDNG